MQFKVKALFKSHWKLFLTQRFHIYMSIYTCTNAFITVPVVISQELKVPYYSYICIMGMLPHSVVKIVFIFALPRVTMKGKEMDFNLG